MSYNKVIEEIEEIINEKIPKMDNLMWNSFGYRVEQGELTGLALFRRELEYLPKSLWGFKNLKILSLVYTNLKELPNEIKSLENLQELYLGGNRFTELPASLKGLSKLKWLYIFESNIKSIPDISNLENLEELVLLNGINVPDPVLKMEESGLKLKFDN